MCTLKKKTSPHKSATPNSSSGKGIWYIRLLTCPVLLNSGSRNHRWAEFIIEMAMKNKILQPLTYFSTLCILSGQSCGISHEIYKQ